MYKHPVFLLLVCSLASVGSFEKTGLHEATLPSVLSFVCVFLYNKKLKDLSFYPIRPEQQLQVTVSPPRDD